MKIENQVESMSPLNPDDFKLKSLEDMVDTILSNLDSTTEQIWNVLLDKLYSPHSNTPPIKAYKKIFDNIDSILNQPIPDKLTLALYGNATNIFSDYEELSKKIYNSNPKLIDQKFQVPPYTKL